MPKLIDPDVFVRARRLVAGGAHLSEAARSLGVGVETLRVHGVRPSEKGRARQREAAARHAYSLRKAWTADSIIDAFHAWTTEHGAPPAAADWNPALARRQGRDDRARRHALGTWPYYSTVVRYFGSWAAGLEAAGWHPRPVGAHRPPRTA